MKSYDVVLLHPPATLMQGENQYPIVPMGEFALASELQRNGFSVKFTNLGLERMLCPSYNVEKYIRSIQSKVFAIDLHWAVHSAGVINVANLCKRYHPDSLVVLGGFTATWFHDQILSKYRSIDAIVLGEAEPTFGQLVRNVIHGKDLKDILGIAYRKGGTVKHSEIMKPNENLDNLDPTNLPALDSWKSYMRISPSGYFKDMRPRFWLSIARGCPYDCVHCGGGRNAYRLLTGRENIAFRSPERVAEDIEKLSHLGVQQISLSHDPEIGAEKYQTQMFDEIKKRHLDICIYNESFRVPSRSFLEKMNRISYETTVAISPESPSDEVRMLAGRGFTNSQMMNAIEDCEDLGVKADIYYMVGLPEETADFLRMFKNVLAKMSDKIWTRVFPPLRYVIDPNCPMATRPEEYGVKCFFRTFDDYKSMSLSSDALGRIGHETRFLTRDKILELTVKANECATMTPLPPMRRPVLYRCFH